MSPKLVIQAMALLVLLAAPALAEEAMPATAEEMPAGASAAAEPDAVGSEEEADAPDAADVEGDATAALPGEDPETAPTPEPDAIEAPESAPASLAPEAADDDTASLAPEAADDDTASLAPEAAGETAASEPALDTHPPFGAVGYDSKGRRGRIHIVVGGDTLWDISDAYLGTPWVWPSIWSDNDQVENPHLIYPGDHIWITPSEMRRITAEEAAVMLSNLPPEPEGEPADLGVAPEPEPEIAPTVVEPVERGSLRVSFREMAGLITPAQLDAAASIVGRVPERVYVAQEDDVFIGLGESEVEKGDQFTIFRTHEKVFDPDTRALLGYHVEFLGWLEVKEPGPESSLANIRMSVSELQEGDRLIPRDPLPQDIPIQASPDVEGKISFFPQKRVVIGYNDFVYLNRGSLDGLEVGSPLDVYRRGYTAQDEARGEKVLVPDYVVGRLLVVRTEAESAVALVTSSETELALGDRFRGAGR